MDKGQCRYAALSGAPKARFYTSLGRRPISVNLGIDNVLAVWQKTAQWPYDSSFLCRFWQEGSTTASLLTLKPVSCAPEGCT